jgi:pyruvate formate lyase activating enzyme
MALTGTIFDIKKYAIHDGPGIRTTVFFKGCPLDCWWCHNPEGRNEAPETFCIRISGDGFEGKTGEKKADFGRIISVDDLMLEISKDIVFYDQSGGGVTFSGGEPLMQPEFLSAVLKVCKKRGIHTAVDTSGEASPEIFEQIIDSVDLFLYDLKIMDDTAHEKYTGVSNRQILDNLKVLSDNGATIQLRLPMIPGITDTEENLDAILRYIEPLSGIQNVSFLPYNKLGEDKLERFGLPSQLGKLEVLSEDEMSARADRFQQRGYRVKIGG